MEERGKEEKGKKKWKWIKMGVNLCNPICAHTMSLYHTNTKTASTSCVEKQNQVQHVQEELNKKNTEYSFLILFGGFDGIAAINNEIQALPLQWQCFPQGEGEEKLTASLQSMTLTSSSSSKISSSL